MTLSAVNTGKDTAWTDELVAVLKSQWEAGHSAGTISRYLGVTRNAVIGKLGRLGMLGKRVNPYRCGEPKPTRKAFPNRLKKETRGMNARQPQIVMALPVPAPETAPPPKGGVTIYNLETHHCRWPLGDEMAPAEKYCGAMAVNGLSYCACHCRIAYRSTFGLSVEARRRLAMGFASAA